MKHYVIRPLRRVAEGRWQSRDGRWTFMRHWSDPHPQRWFTYQDADEEPADLGAHIRLRDAAAWAASQRWEPPPCPTCGDRAVEARAQEITELHALAPVTSSGGEVRYICPEGHHFTQDGTAAGDSMPPDIAIDTRSVLSG